MALLGDTKAVSLTLLDGVIGDLNPKTTEVYNLGTSSLKWNNIYGTLKGNADTATEFSSNATVTLTGDTVGTSAGSKKSWSITTTTSNLTAVNDGANAIIVSPGTKKLKYSYHVDKSTSGLFNANNNSNAIFTFNRHDGNYDSQLGFSNNGNIYYRAFDGTALNTTKAWKQLAFTNSDITGNAATATTAEKLSNTSKIGDTNRPVYFTASGVPEAISYTIDADVPSTAVFTDTKNTAGSTDTSSKIYLIGATELADNPLTYSDDLVYVTNGTLYLVKATDLSGTANNKPALIVGGADTAAHMEFDTNEILAKGTGTTTAALYLNNDGGLVTVGSGGLGVTSLTASQAVSTDADKKLVSTNLTVSDPTASGTGITYIATISQSAVGKITVTKSTVRSASTSLTGVLQFTAANTNAQLNTLTTGASTPTDADYYISQYVGGGTTTTTYHRRPMSALWDYIKGKITNGIYWANEKATSSATYNTTPEVASVKYGNGTTTTTATKSFTVQFNETDESLDFIYTG